MAIQVQLRRGNATDNDAFTGAIGELSYDTTNNQVRIHDGSTAGGFKIGVGNFPTGTNNVALGNTALDSLDSGSPGGNNTAVGHDSLTANTTASFNTALGVNSGSLITTGQKNTIVGAFDGNQGGLDIRTSNSHIVLSDGDGNPRLVIDDSGNVDIGDATTELKLKNTTHEDTDGGRESKITFQGEQSGGEQSVLAQIQASHDGTSDDEKGDLIFRTNDGSDGTSPTERMRIDSTGATSITVTGNEDTLSLISTDADANDGPILRMYRNSSSPADSDLTGMVKFSARNDNSQDVDYGTIRTFIRDASDGTEDGTMQINHMVGGTLQTALELDNDEYVFNNAGIDIDFRVESDSNANTIFVDASEPSVGFGVGTGDTTTARMAVGLTGAAVSGNTDGATIGKGSTLRLVDDTNWSTTNSTIFLMGGGTGGAIGQISSAIGFARESNANWGTQLKFYTHPADTSDIDELDERARFDAAGNFIVGDTEYPTMGTDTGTGSVMSANGQFRAISDGDVAGYFKRLSNNGTVLQFYRSQVSVGRIDITTSATSYITSSDHRMKENVTDLSDGITRVKQLDPKRFNFISEPDSTVDGFLAHEVQTVVPEAISGTHNEVEVWKEGEELPDGVSVGDNKLDDNGNTIPIMQGIDHGKLVPLLTAALQEAIAKIETLETQVAALGS